MDSQKTVDGNDFAVGKIEDKVFGRVLGSITPESIVVGKEDISFDLKTGKNIHKFSVGEQIITKLFSLHGLSYRNVISESNSDMSLIQDTIRRAVKAYNRNVVVLVDDMVKPVSIVSEQHKQLPLSKACNIVDSIAKKNGAQFIGMTENNSSYKLDYEIGRDNAMSVRVSAFLGRNDALGRAGIHFEGGGHIFVCSNMIVPHIDADVKFSSDVKLSATKIVHTLKVESRLKSSLQKSFECAKKNALLLSESFENSKSIVMPRALQRHCVELYRLKNSLPDKWNSEIVNKLYSEEETLYGLSQAITWVGTHRCGKDSEIGRKLLRLGGQVVLLGNDFVKLITKSLVQKQIEVPEVKTQASF